MTLDDEGTLRYFSAILWTQQSIKNYEDMHQSNPQAKLRKEDYVWLLKSATEEFTTISIISYWPSVRTRVWGAGRPSRVQPKAAAAAGGAAFPSSLSPERWIHVGTFLHTI